MESGAFDPTAPAMRASNSDRQAVVEQLQKACSEGRLTLEEFSERSSAAYGARTHSDLAPLVRDLPAAAIHRPPVVDRFETAAPVIAIFGAADRRGRWRPARRETAVALFGGVALDFRDAELPAEPLLVRAYAVFGGIDITVPEGARVEMTGFSLFGGRDAKVDDGPPAATRAVFRISAVAIFGGVSVKAKKPRWR